MENMNCKEKSLNNTSRKFISFKHKIVLLTNENIKKILDIYNLPYDTDFDDFLNFRNQFGDSIRIYHDYKKFKEDNHLTWREVKKLKSEEILKNYIKLANSNEKNKSNNSIMGHKNIEVTLKYLVKENNDKTI